MFFPNARSFRWSCVRELPQGFCSLAGIGKLLVEDLQIVAKSARRPLGKLPVLRLSDRGRGQRYQSPDQIRLQRKGSIFKVQANLQAVFRN